MAEATPYVRVGYDRRLLIGSLSERALMGLRACGLAVASILILTVAMLLMVWCGAVVRGVRPVVAADYQLALLPAVAAFAVLAVLAPWGSPTRVIVLGAGVLGFLAPDLPSVPLTGDLPTAVARVLRWFGSLWSGWTGPGLLILLVAAMPVHSLAERVRVEARFWWRSTWGCRLPTPELFRPFGVGRRLLVVPLVVAILMTLVWAGAVLRLSLESPRPWAAGGLIATVAVRRETESAGLVTIIAFLACFSSVRGSHRWLRAGAVIALAVGLTPRPLPVIGSLGPSAGETPFMNVAGIWGHEASWGAIACLGLAIVGAQVVAFLLRGGDAVSISVARLWAKRSG